MTSAPTLGEPLPVELMNTIWAGRDGIHDALTSPTDLTGWLHLPDSDVVPLDEFRALRDALRRLAADVTEDTRAVDNPLDLETAVDVVNRSCAHAPSWSSMSWPTTRAVESAHTFADAALSNIAEQAVDLFTGPDRQQLRACYAPGCVLYFIRNHPRREWCSAGCGNRARVARHYRRHHADS
jgi:predicted RNA-binding Zn ribbon-like protein